MGKISIEGTSKTPTVLFDSESGVMELKGRSIPENSIEFYKPIVESLEKVQNLLQKLKYNWSTSIPLRLNVF